MKKLIATLLALLMLTASFGAAAEGLADYVQEDYKQTAIDMGRRVTTTIALSDVASDFIGDPAVDQVIADLLKALTITVYTQGDENYYAIGMAQESGDVADLLTLGVAVQGEDAYLMSNLIGGTIVVAQDEVVPLMERLVDVFVQMCFLTEDDAAAFKAQLPEVMDMVMQEVGMSVAAEEMLNNIDVTALNYNALLNIVSMAAGKLTEAEVDVLPKNCDTAVAMYTMTLTPDEMNSISAAAFQFIKDNPDLAEAIATYIDFDGTIAPSMSGVVEGNMDFMTFIDTMMAEMTEANLFAGDVVYRYWVGEDGMPVAMDAVAPINADGETVNMTMNYTRMTLNSAVAHSFIMSADGADVTVNAVVAEGSVKVSLAFAENGETIMDVYVDYTDCSDAAYPAAADVKVEITMSDAVIDDGYGNVSTSDIVIALDISTRTAFQGWDFTESTAIGFSLNGKHYLTLNVNTQSSEAGASITAGNVVRPAALTDAEFVNWFIGAFNNLYSWLYTAMYALPASVMNLINTGF